MNKEHVKSILLTGLVGMNIVLGSQILLDKKLWSSDYNFFNIENFSILKIFSRSQNIDESFKKVSHLTMPEKIIFNTGDQTTRFSLNSNNKEYTDIIDSERPASKHEKMSLEQRAKQFSPFAALGEL